MEKEEKGEELTLNLCHCGIRALTAAFSWRPSNMFPNWWRRRKKKQLQLTQGEAAASEWGLIWCVGMSCDLKQQQSHLNGLVMMVWPHPQAVLLLWKLLEEKPASVPSVSGPPVNSEYLCHLLFAVCSTFYSVC